MKYLRRGIWYVAGRLLVICLVLGLMITVFYYTMNLSNIQIVLKDGMAGRAKYVMGVSSQRSDLEKFFQTGYLDSDELVLKTPMRTITYAVSITGCKRVSSGSGPGRTTFGLTLRNGFPGLTGG